MADIVDAESRISREGRDSPRTAESRAHEHNSTTALTIRAKCKLRAKKCRSKSSNLLRGQKVKFITADATLLGTYHRKITASERQ